MIQEILGQIFPIEFGFDPDTIHVPLVRHNAPFTVTDPRACDPCQGRRPERADCNREILKVDNRGEGIALVEYEQYITQYTRLNRKNGERCDILMTDSGMGRRKIVFCDLCCYSEKYVEPNAGKFPEGKRAKAYRQMERSIETLIQEPITAVNLLKYQEKICLFAWRDYNVPDSPVRAAHGNVRANVQAFGTTASNLAAATTTHHQKMGQDFTFMQVKYPSVYLW